MVWLQCLSLISRQTAKESATAQFGICLNVLPRERGSVTCRKLRFLPAQRARCIGSLLRRARLSNFDLEPTKVDVLSSACGYQNLDQSREHEPIMQQRFGAQHIARMNKS